MSYIGKNPRLKSIVSQGDTLANLTAEPRVAGRLVWATDQNKFYFDNGTSLVAVEAGVGGGSGSKTLDMRINGVYGGTSAYNGVDGLWIAPTNINITGVFIYQEINGISGSTTLDIKVKPFGAGSFVSIFSTVPAVASTAAVHSWCGPGDVVTGYTAPILIATPVVVAAKSALRMDLLGSQTGQAAGVGLIIIYEEV